MYDSLYITKLKAIYRYLILLIVDTEWPVIVCLNRDNKNFLYTILFVFILWAEDTKLKGRNTSNMETMIDKETSALLEYKLT